MSSNSWYRELDEFTPRVDGPLSKLFTNPLSVVLLWSIKELRLRPIWITLAGFVIGCGAVVYICSGTLFGLVLGGVLVQISFIVDGLDGTYARYSKQTSYFGGWVDRLLDRIVDTMLVVALGVRFSVHPYLILAAIVSNIIYWRMNDLSAVTSQSSRKVSTQRWFGKLEERCQEKGIRLVFGRDLFLWTITFGCFSGEASQALLLVVLLSSLSWLMKFTWLGGIIKRPRFDSVGRVA